MSQYRVVPKTPMSTRKKIVIAGAALLCAPFLIAGMISGAEQSLGTKQSSASSRSSVPPASTPAHQASTAPVAADPTFAYPGDPHCAITYRSDGKAAMIWTAKVTLTGELITHASDRSGNIYRRDVQVSAGPNSFSAPVPLSQIDDIGGVLYVGSTSYGCSIAPQSTRPHRARRRHHRHAASASPAPPPPATAASCYPLSNEGTCYEPGEYCRDSDHGMSGLAGDGEKIICEDNNGWRWEPA